MSTSDAAPGPAPTGTPARRRRRTRFVWLIAVVALIALTWVFTWQARASDERDRAAATEAVVGLLSRALKGEPDALKELVPFADRSLLTPAAAEVALGKNPRIEPVGASLSSRGHDTATVKIVAQGGDILVTLPVVRSSQTHDYKAQGPLSLPTVSPASYVGAPDAVYTINGESTTIAALRKGAHVWPGTVRITPPSSEIFSFPTPPETFLGGRLSRDFDGANVRIDTAAMLRPAFERRAAAALETWLKPCLVADDKVPAWCPVPPADGPWIGRPVRNVTWSAPVVVPPSGEPWLREVSGTSSSVTRPVFDVDISNGVLIGVGEVNDGTTWLEYKEANTLRIRGTLGVDGDKLTFTQSADKEQSNREERS